jgi:hypothetical protein
MKKTSVRLPLFAKISLVFTVWDSFTVHVNRDQILLNGERLHEDDDGDEDEVFALKGMPASSSSEEEDEEEEDGHLDAPNEASSNLRKNRTNGKKPRGAPGSTAVEDEKTEESEEEETWGSKKSAYYSTNAAHFDSEDEEANNLEEEEAKRLQSKTRDALTDEDFGLADNVEVLLQENPYVSLKVFSWFLDVYFSYAVTSQSQKCSNHYLKTSRLFYATWRKRLRKLSHWPVTGMTLHTA